MLVGGAGSSFVVTNDGSTLPLADCPCLRADLGKACRAGDRSVEPTASAEPAAETTAEAAVSFTLLVEGS